MEVPPTVLPESVASMRTPARTGTPSSVTGDCPTTTASPPQSSPAAAVGTPPKPNTVAPTPNIVARHSTLRRQSLQPGTNRLYELAAFVASYHDATETSAASGAVLSAASEAVSSAASGAVASAASEPVSSAASEAVSSVASEASGAVASGASGAVASGASGVVASGASGAVASGAVAYGASGAVASGAPGAVASGASGAVASGAPAVGIYGNSAAVASGAVASGAEDSRGKPPPTTKRTRKRRRRTCCADTCYIPAAEATNRTPKEATPPVAAACHQNESSKLHPSLEATLQFAALHSRLTNAVDHLTDVATARASNLCITREKFSRQLTLPSAIHALDAEVTSELEVVSELSNIASDIAQLTQLWMATTEYRLIPYEAISLSVEQLIRDAQEASTNEAYRTNSNGAPTSNAEVFIIEAPERHRRKNVPRKLLTDAHHATSTDPTQEDGKTAAQPDKEYGDAAAKMDDRQ